MSCFIRLYNVLDVVGIAAVIAQMSVQNWQLIWKHLKAWLESNQENVLVTDSNYKIWFSLKFSV